MEHAEFMQNVSLVIVGTKIRFANLLDDLGIQQPREGVNRAGFELNKRMTTAAELTRIHDDLGALSTAMGIDKSVDEETFVTAQKDFLVALPEAVGWVGLDNFHASKAMVEGVLIKIGNAISDAGLRIDAEFDAAMQDAVPVRPGRTK